MNKQIKWMVLALLICSPFWGLGGKAWGWGGSGTQNDPYILASVSDLNSLASNVNNGMNYAGVYFKITDRLDYSNVTLFDSDGDRTEDSNFTQIGIVTYREDGTSIYDNSFCGIFDGNDMTITGITVNHPGGEAIGIFGNAAYPAVIKNLKVASSTFSGNYCVGAIVGEYNNTGNTTDTWGIYNCSNKLYYPNANMTINAFRGYFLLKNSLVCGEPTSTDNGINNFVLNFGDETNSIENGKLKIENEAGVWYDLTEVSHPLRFGFNL